MKLFAVLLTVFAALIVDSPATVSQSAAARFSVTVTDDLGFKVHLTKVPTRIISLDPRDTETLFALGLEKYVVADGTHYAEGVQDMHTTFKPSQWPSPYGRDYPIKAPQLPHIEGGCCGAPFNLELIESLRPDLVVSINSDAPTLQKMRDLGIKVLVFDPANFKGTLHDILTLGKETNQNAHAALVVKNMQAEINAVTSALKGVKSKPRVYYELDATNPTQPYTAGPGTFIDEAIKIAHGVNVADSTRSCSGKDCFPQFSLEALVKLDPQIIMLGDAGYGESQTTVKSRPGWSTISAVQTGKIYPFDADPVNRAGPRLAIGIRDVAKLIHPSAFKK